VDNAPEDNWLDAGASYVHEDEEDDGYHVPVGSAEGENVLGLDELLAELEEIANDEFEED